MRDSKDLDDIEICTYVQIIEYFENEVNEDEREIFRDVKLIKLMDELKQDPTIQDVVKNSIVIMNAMMDEKNPPDTFNNIGRDINEISEEERNVLMQNLSKQTQNS